MEILFGGMNYLWWSFLKAVYLTHIVFKSTTWLEQQLVTKIEKVALVAVKYSLVLPNLQECFVFYLFLKNTVLSLFSSKNHIITCVEIKYTSIKMVVRVGIENKSIRFSLRFHMKTTLWFRQGIKEQLVSRIFWICFGK